ncbi:PhnA domain-containing protein [Porticoccus litoralis]|jgi:protein PhnA|uniref:PhnA domain-containing protein n=1 Tax=Porticoccus litoralis TaxID=434086 RepID=A0AAW8B5P5_9GAMM|nr:alkylphosphonate utilization protein [Porticoccus litoralis]MDP1521167.1 PhnA domain-containing protein [Porticoccus litoralis]
MNIELVLQERSGNQCELCKNDTALSVYPIPPELEASDEKAVLLCATCREQIEQPELLDPNHWRCLNDSMWSQVPAVQVMAWRMLSRLREEVWARDLLDMLYLEDEVMAWAKQGHAQEQEPEEVTRDCNGAELQAGDNVTLIKDLDVKGAGFTAKRGTTVRNISLTANPEQIEGRVNGVRIVLLTCYLKKAN